jgi:hypothetical protein
MRTAEEILESQFKNKYFKVYFLEIKNHMEQYDAIISAINEAKKQAIEECAERAKVSFEKETFAQIDKQSILSLINELK